MTPFPQTMIDYAARASLSKVRQALAQADYDGGLNVAAIEAELRPGCPGVGRLRLALSDHQPRLARTRSGLEIAFFELCEADGLPLPEPNAEVAGWDVDALWRRERVAVELDGPWNHGSRAQVRRDRRKELDLRAAQLLLLRYSDDQVDHHGEVVIAEVRQMLNRADRAA